MCESDASGHGGEVYTSSLFVCPRAPAAGGVGARRSAPTLATSGLPVGKKCYFVDFLCTFSKDFLILPALKDRGQRRGATPERRAAGTVVLCVGVFLKERPFTFLNHDSRFIILPIPTRFTSRNLIYIYNVKLKLLLFNP